MTLLTILAPIINLIPTIKPPVRKTNYKDKMYWTIVVLLIYLVFSQMPLFGIHLGGSDPLYWLRVIMASNRGTLMELGISPLMTSGLLMQLLSGAGIISVDQSGEGGRALFEGAQKMLGLIITLLQAVGYVFSGMYGSPATLGLIRIGLIIGQLLFSGLILMLLDDLLQNGWGIGSGANLFIATNYCENVIWKALSPATFGMGRKKVFEGALIATVQVLSQSKNKLRAVKEALFRPQFPNLSNLFATIAVFAGVVFLQGFRVDLPLQHVKLRGHSATFPIKLFYTSSMPVILQNAVVSNLFFVSQLLSKHFPTNPIARILGVWESKGSHGMPVGGIIYYLSPPKSIFDDPVHLLTYILFTVISCGFFSRVWVEMSGSSPKEVAAKLQEQGMVIRGYRQESFAKILYRYIPVAAWCGGVVIGILTIVADLLGAVGSGTGILLAVSTIFQYYEAYVKEAQPEGTSIIGL